MKKVTRNSTSVSKVRAEWLGTRFHEYLGKHAEGATSFTLQDEYDCTSREVRAGMRYARALADDCGQYIPAAVPGLGFIYVLLDDGVDPYPAVQAVAHLTRAKNGLERKVTEHHEYLERHLENLAPPDRPLAVALIEQHRDLQDSNQKLQQAEDRMAAALIESERLRRVAS